MVEYTSNNYAALNQAIEVESEKYRALSKVRRSKAFMYTCAGIALVLIAGAIAYLIFVRANEPNSPKILVAAPESVSDTDALKTLASKEEDNSETSPDFLAPDKYFTEFFKVTADSGETVTTGRRFLPKNLETPFMQYCYLETKGLSGTPLARKDGQAPVEFAKVNETLLRYARNYCRFTD